MTRTPTIHARRALAVAVAAIAIASVAAVASAAPPGPAITVDDASVIEGDDGYTDLVFTVRLSAATGRTITVDYVTVDGTAAAPADYQPTAGQVVFNKRETVKAVRVPVYGDTTYEGDETLTLRLSGASSGTIVDATAIGTIIENDPPTQPLTVQRTGDGDGHVGSEPAGIDCGSDCREDFDAGASVTLTATAATGSIFEGWTGDCSGTDTTCTVTMDQARSVMAAFGLPAYQTLTVSVVGESEGSEYFGWDTATGYVSSDPSGIDCHFTYEDGQTGDCEESFAAETLVTLTATPGDVIHYSYGGTAEPSGKSSSFAGWDGACAGTDTTCTVTMDQARNVTASFSLPTYQSLTVSVEGEQTSSEFHYESATGSVTSEPAGIDCQFTHEDGQTGDCGESYAWDTVVTLTATPGDAMMTFTGVTAPSGQSTFAGWDGPCSGTDPTCTVTMDQAHHVTAYFALPDVTTSTHTMTVDVTGESEPTSDGTAMRTSEGSVTSSPAGIDCRYVTTHLGAGEGGDCDEDYGAGTLVTLTATPGDVIVTGWTTFPYSDGTSVFLGWGGACSGTESTCTVTMDQARHVTAAFGLPD